MGRRRDCQFGITLPITGVELGNLVSVASGRRRRPSLFAPYGRASAAASRTVDAVVRQVSRRAIGETRIAVRGVKSDDLSKTTGGEGEFQVRLY